jgi:putative phosphoribosyl transferase
MKAATKEVVIVPGAGHLFEEPGTLDEVVRHATGWFLHYLSGEREGGAGHVAA